MTQYELVADEDAAGERLGWRLFEDVGAPRWEEIATIGRLPTADAKDWAASRITSVVDEITWRSTDGSVFSARWRTVVSDPWDDED